MAIQLSFLDVRLSRFPTVLGLCQSNDVEVASALNEVTQRLLYAGGETGFVNCWKRIVLQVDPSNPYITLPPQFARIINLAASKVPFRIHNAFYELLPGSVGVQRNCGNDWCGSIQGYEREPSPTMVDMAGTNQILRVYLTDSRDVGQRILVTGKDANGNEVYSQDGANHITGIFIPMVEPFNDAPFELSEIGTIQKDVTFGDVLLKQVDQTTGVEVLLSRYGPKEINPKYRRYFITHLPRNCTVNADGTIPITAIVKLEYQPVALDTDQLIISNLPALIEEAQSLRYSTMDVPNAAMLEQKHHMKAIRLLQDEQRHIEGEQEIAVSVNSFEGMGLRENRIGSLI